MLIHFQKKQFKEVQADMLIYELYGSTSTLYLSYFKQLNNLYGLGLRSGFMLKKPADI